MMPKKNSENSAASHVYEKNRYLAKIVRWLDGDTVELELDLGMSCLLYTSDAADE